MKTDDKYSKLRLRAETVLKKKGIEKPEKFYRDVEKLVEELNVHQIELEMQNLELQEATQRLQVEQNKYFDLYKNAPIAYFTLNKTGNIYELNNQAANLLGMPRQVFNKTSLFVYLTENSKQRFTQFFKKVFQSNNIEYTEIEFVNRCSEIIHAKLDAQSYFDYDKNETLCRCAVTNISEEIKLKQTVDAEQNKFKLLTDNSFDIISILADDGTIKFESNAIKRILGYNSGDRIGQSVFNYIHPDDIEYIIKKFQELISKPHNHTVVQFRFKHQNGDWKWLETSGQNFLDNSTINGIIINSRDITERKEAEIQKNYLSAIIKNTENICVIKDLDLRVIATNESFAKAAGKDSVKELIGKTDAEIFQVSPDVEPIKGYMTDELNTQKLKKGEKILREENVIYPDKSIKTVLTTKFPVYDNNNKLIATANISTDISEQKQAELAIKESEEKYRLITENASDVIWILNLSRDAFTYVSPSVFALRGYTPEEAMEQDINESLTAGSAKEITEEIKQILPQFLENPEEISKKTYSHELRQTCKDGSIIWTETTSRIQFNSNHEVEILGISRNIEERKRADLAIKESEKRYKELFDNLIDEVHVWNIVKDKNGEIKTWKLADINRSALKAWGKTKNQVIGKTADAIFKDNSTEKFMPIIKKIFTSGKPLTWESYFPPTNQFLSMTSIPLGNRFISTGRDVTKEKAAEDALQESEERYSMIFERTKNPIVITDLKGYMVQFNEAAPKQLGYTKEEYGKLHISQIDVNDKPMEVVERMEKIKKEGAVFFETKHREKNGQILDIMVSAALIKIKNEHYNLAVFNDISPIKQAHKKIVEQNILLHEQEEELKHTLETKEVLLKEVHHRVKNNLQTVSSLLYQQKTLSKDPKIAHALNDSMNRVSSMALIHQYIYKSSDLKNINIKQYISELVSKLKESYQKQQQNIQLIMEIDDIEFDIDKTIPVALMMNEILSNIFKYAFTDKEAGKINISLKKQDVAKVKLVISDNGIGFPENFDAEKSKSLGMYLIVNFAKLQLAGDLTINSKPNKGVKYEIIF